MSAKLNAEPWQRVGDVSREVEEDLQNGDPQNHSETLLGIYGHTTGGHHRRTLWRVDRPSTVITPPPKVVLGNPRAFKSILYILNNSDLEG